MIYIYKLLFIFLSFLIIKCGEKPNRNVNLYDNNLTATSKNKILNDTININFLFGHWKAYKKTTIDGGDMNKYALDKKNSSVYLSLNILDSDTVIYDAGIQEYKLKYIIENNKLIISNQSYVIVSLTTNELVLKEEIVLGGLIYFKKN